MDIGQALIIVTIIWLAVLSPGADFAIVSKNSLIHGRAAGFASSLGIASACWLHVSYAIFGIVIIQNTLPNLFEIIKVIGAAYLVYLGVSTAFSSPNPVASTNATTPRRKYSFYGNGLLTNSLNPKTSIFVISLYTQVIGPQTPLMHQVAWGLFISLSHLIWFSMVSMFMSSDRIRSRILDNQRFFNIVIGSILTMFGLLLFFVDGLEGVEFTSGPHNTNL